MIKFILPFKFFFYYKTNLKYHIILENKLFQGQNYNSNYTLVAGWVYKSQCLYDDDDIANNDNDHPLLPLITLQNTLNHPGSRLITLDHPGPSSWFFCPVYFILGLVSWVLVTTVSH